MDRAKFLEKLRASSVQLVPFTIEGWEEPIYLKPQTMADIREILAESNGAESKTVAETLAKDPYYIERGIAKIIRDKDGNRLFDFKDDVQMVELRGVLDSNRAIVSRQIQDAYNALNEPTKVEVDPKGN